MRELGVFDNSSIIIVGDHGFHAAPWYPTTSLLIKPPGATGRLMYNSEAELSNAYFGASLLEMANIAHSELGLSYFDIINGAPPPPRRFYHDWGWNSYIDSKRTMAIWRIYEVTGDAMDSSSWVVLEQFD